MRFAVAILLWTATSAYCQSPTATVIGRITDASGSVVPNVSIKVTNLDTNRVFSSVSNSAGDYTVPYLAPGTYSLQAEASGFGTHKQSGFTLVVDQEQRIDIKMEVGASSQTITITEAPEALTTESGSRGTVTSNAELTEMPLNGRNYSDLAFLADGVVPKGEGGDGQFAVNGARADNVSLMVDGMNNTQRRNTTSMVSPPLESVQEFKLTTSGFSAEYGRFAGGVLSMVSKSGGNRLRGTLYEFLRNNAFDARNFFSLANPKLIQNQFGATVTGPVVLPKLYNGKDKTFFLFSWESQRQLGGSTTRGSVPAAGLLSGNFSKATDAFGKPETINDPLAKNTPFPGNIIPSARLDPVARAIGAYYPQPNIPSGTNNYYVQANSKNDYNKFSTKVDHSIGNNDRLTFSTLWNKSDSINPFQRSPIAIFAGTTANFGLLSGIRYIHTFSPSMYNEASVNFSRNTFDQRSVGSDHDWSADVGFKGATKDPSTLASPTLQSAAISIWARRMIFRKSGPTTISNTPMPSPGSKPATPSNLAETFCAISISTTTTPICADA